MVTTVVTIKQKKGVENPKRAFKGITQTFNNETIGNVIDKRGFGLIEFNFPAGGGTLTFRTGLTPTPIRIDDRVSIDASSEKSSGTSDFAGWAFIQPVFSTPITGDVEFALS